MDKKQLPRKDAIARMEPLPGISDLWLTDYSLAISAKRTADALESIARSLAKIANPLIKVDNE